MLTSILITILVVSLVILTVVARDYIKLTAKRRSDYAYHRKVCKEMGWTPRPKSYYFK